MIINAVPHGTSSVLSEALYCCYQGRPSYLVIKTLVAIINVVINTVYIMYIVTARKSMSIRPSAHE
jgi:hypothetical protein